MRGCSCGFVDGCAVCPVFPAYAGMFLSAAIARMDKPCFPRVCGDVPAELGDLQAHGLFSPRMRGCSVTSWTTPEAIQVFPAYAGMFRILHG